MDHIALSSDANEDPIDSATSIDEIIATLAKHDCKDLTSSVDLAACSENACGGGGFCEVYRGELYDGTHIAIKSLRVYHEPEADIDKRKILKNAARELHHWSRLQHPNVLPLLGLMIFQGRMAMVSQWMEHGNLTDFIRERPDANRTRLCMDICDGLCYIHAQGMVHGDLKAANVMVSPREVAMIGDFGNAQMKDLTLPDSGTAGRNMSLRWTAPELVVAENGYHPSKEADVYAYGMTVLEVMTGEIPYGEIGERRVYILVVSGKHPSRPEVILDNDWTLMKDCWSTIPSERPTMKSLSNRLEALYPYCRPVLEEELGPDTAHRSSRIQATTRADTQSIVQKADQLTNLGITLLSRFERLGELPDLNKAIECHTQAVLLTPDGHPNKPGQLNNLGASYRARFERFGEFEDIDKAIECHTRAVQLTPDGHPNNPGQLNNLGASYRAQFERLGEVEDLNKAIEYQSQAVLLTPDGHPNKPGQLNNLGASYRARFERLGELEDLNMAIEYQSQAMLFTPDGHPNKPGQLNNLGASYRARFERLGELEDLNKAIEYQSQAVLLTPDGHPNRSGQLNNLGASYRARFERFGEFEDIEKAIECHTRAVQLTPDGHPGKPGQLNDLGISSVRRFESLGDLAGMEVARSCFQQAAQQIVVYPALQFSCARNWVKSSLLLDLSPQLAYERCLELLPHVIRLETTIGHRYQRSTIIRDLATEAAAWAISMQYFDLAIEWLEQGRIIVWNQIIQLRTPLDELSAVDPELAQRLKAIASNLEAAGSSIYRDSSTNINPDLEAAAQHHRRLAAEWDLALEQVRHIPGFHTFMRPCKARELKLAATDGPVILINAHSTRCDALILFPQCDDIVHVPLNALTQDKAGRSCPWLDHSSLAINRGAPVENFGHVEWVRGGDIDDVLKSLRNVVEKNAGESTARLVPRRRRLAGAGGFGRVRLEPESPYIAGLPILWETVVKPILDTLACTRKMPVDELPHVTWCATGVFACLPFHAAGPHDGSSPNAFDLVISSYTPSLSALRTASLQVSRPNLGLLAVGQEYTRGFSRMPGTTQELAAIKMHAKAIRFQQLDGSSATVNAVLTAMEDNNWVHLACGSSQNPGNPVHSAFHLHDGPLTLEAITKRSFRNKGLAFLSAADSAAGDAQLPDEAVHLAAGMLVAGYPSVIATMFTIHDEDAPLVAEEVYAELLKDGNMDHRRSARALHKAVASLREKVGPDSFERWVPFIHIGV